MRRAALLAAAALLVAAAPPGPHRHVVSAGETLAAIAERSGVPEEAIAEANGLRPPYRLRRGQRLAIPVERRHRVAAGETGFAIGWRYALPWERIALANGLDPEAAVRPGQTLTIPFPAATAQPTPGLREVRFAAPLDGEIRRRFAAGSRKHDGLDIVAPAGTPVRAAAPGRVIFAGTEPEQFGNLVVVDHGGGWHSAYAFLSRIAVREGSRVAAGERIGLVGRTGRATRDELHFELRRNNRPLDPLPLLMDDR